MLERMLLKRVLDEVGRLEKAMKKRSAKSPINIELNE